MATDPALQALSADLLERFKRVKVLLMDVDGVLTDGRLYYIHDEKGKAIEFKGFHSQDGLGFHFLNSVGIKTGVISGRVSFATEERARILKMSFVYQGLLEKEGAYEEVLQKANVTADEVAYVGDDFTDVPLMLRSGLGCAVADAREEVRNAARFVTSRNGGHGALREIIELILKAQNKWDGILEKYQLKSAARAV